MTRPIERVLVTGAAGLIGRATVAELAQRGTHVTALSLRVAEPIEGASSTVQADAADVDAVAAAMHGADAVVHLAAIPHRDHGTPLEVYATNVTATFNVLSRAGLTGVGRAVIASSINAYGVPLHHEPLLPAYFPLDEELPEAIDDWYSLSKKADEMSLQMVASHWGVSGVALRLPWVAGREKLRHEARANAADPARGLRTGWSYLDPRDAAIAIADALSAEYTGAHVVGLAAPETLSPFPTEDLLDAYAPGVPRRRRFAGREVPVEVARARALFGFAPRHALELEPAALPHDVTSPTTDAVR